MRLSEMAPPPQIAMFDKLLDRFYTGVLGRDMVYVVGGWLPWYACSQVHCLGSRIVETEWLNYSILVILFYVTGILLSEGAVWIGFVRTNPGHSFASRLSCVQCRCFAKFLRFESWFARGPVSFKPEFAQNYYAFMILLQQRNIPMAEIVRIVFLKHLTACVAASLLSTALIAAGALGLCVTFVLVGVSVFFASLNWYFWRHQFNAVHRVCERAGLYWEDRPVAP